MYICFLSLLAACSSAEKKIDIPKNVIPPQKMTEVLRDVQLMQSHVDQERLVDPYILDSTGAYYNAVYQKYNISKAEFDSSMSFYSKEPALLDSIYNRMFAQLQEMDLDLENVKYDAPKTTYLSREELIDALKQLRFKNYLLQDSVNFINARDSLDRFLKTHRKQLDSTRYNPAQIRNSFGVYANSEKRIKQLKEDLKK